MSVLTAVIVESSAAEMCSL